MGTEVGKVYREAGLFVRRASSPQLVQSRILARRAAPDEDHLARQQQKANKADVHEGHGRPSTKCARLPAAHRSLAETCIYSMPRCAGAAA